MNRLVIIASLALLASGCETYQERAERADAEFKEQKVELLGEYRDCVRRSDGREDRLNTCDHYLKALEALK
jgi:hypothetical protein